VYECGRGKDEKFGRQRRKGHTAKVLEKKFGWIRESFAQYALIIS
jgi:hypothetical protein